MYPFRRIRVYTPRSLIWSLDSLLFDSFEQTPFLPRDVYTKMMLLCGLHVRSIDLIEHGLYVAASLKSSINDNFSLGWHPELLSQKC